MVGPTTGVRTEPQVAPPPPPPPPPRLSPVEQGAQARRDAQMAELQRTNYPEYVRQMGATLSPEDRANPFAYSLDHSVPIEVKRQVYAEYQSGQHAPRTEVTRMSGSNATYSEREGPNGTIRVNADLIGNDPARRGQTEAFAVWGHMEEVGHWADARAQTIMGTPGGDATGDEGARYALLASGAVTDGPRDGMIARYDIPVTGGRPRTIEVDTVVLKALAAEKLSNGSFTRENRVDGVENFGPEGHYQTTYITAAGAASALGLPRAEADGIANRLALGSQLPDMLENFDAASQFKAKAADIAKDALIRLPFSEPRWTPAEQRHLESVYEGLHALPRNENSTATWQRSERAETAAFIRDRIAADDFVTAGVAIHRFGDLHAHVRPENGLPYSGDLGHGTDFHTPDYMYTEGANGRAASWSKVTDYQESLSNVIAGGLVTRQQRMGRELPPNALAAATEGGRTTWRNVYDSALATSAREDRWFGPDGADTDSATETYFRNSASAFINSFHAGAGGRFAPLPIGQTGVGGGYPASSDDIRSLDTVRNRFDAFR